MRWSRCFIPTLRESPAGAETAAEKLLVRAGFMRAVSSGVYGYLPLGMRSLGKIQGIARTEMSAIGGQEVALDACTAAEIARGELRSAKLLPQTWFRIESGLLRARQFAGLDVYWFGADGAAEAGALRRIVQRCGVEARWSEGGAVALSQAGPDPAVVCKACGYAASLASARSIAQPSPADVEGQFASEPFATPGQKTIADLSRFTGQPESMQMKSLAMVADGKPVLVMLRGDHQLSEAKFAAKAGANFRQATADELVKWFGASAGSLGPVGVTSIPVWMDRALAGRRNMVCGANRDGYHLRHVTPGEDFEAETCDLREAAAGDGCVVCAAPLSLHNAVELARIGEGVARVALDRLLTMAVESSNDKDGMILQSGVAPFDVIVTALDPGAESLYAELAAAGIDVLLDDRDERPGVKFKDADLIGVPWRITVGRKFADGVVEVVERRTRVVREMPAAETTEFLIRYLA